MDGTGGRTLALTTTAPPPRRRDDEPRSRTAKLLADRGGPRGRRLAGDLGDRADLPPDRLHHRRRAGRRWWLLPLQARGARAGLRPYPSPAARLTHRNAADAPGARLA